MMNKDSKTLRELAIELPGATGVFEKLGLDYCCGGKKSLQEACASLGLDFGDTLEMLDQAEASRSQGESLTDYRALPLRDLITEIVDRHHDFTRKQLELLDALLSKVSSVHGKAHPELPRLRPVLDALAEDLTTHMLKEEHLLFPYIQQLEDADNINGPLPSAFFGTVRNPIQMMLHDHDKAAELLKQIRSETSEFSLPPNACTSYRALYREFSELERDLHRHIHLENNFLFPGATELEDGLLNTKEQPARA